jgi:DNA polymerase III subunit gamma/tau
MKPLHLIAQKSDGALRDALSMFDLIVAYSNDRHASAIGIQSSTFIFSTTIITFRITDQLLAENGAAVLLTFDEILAQGFDGQNFILGLASHFRDLMMCMESATLPLLQASESVKARYSAQAARVSYSFLLSALNITNACDLNYKGSKNQRLHVEITLLKLAHLHQVLDLNGISEAAEVKKKA